MSADSKSKPAPSAAVDPSAALVSFWAQWMEQSSRGTQAILEAVQSTTDPNQLQKRWMDAMSDSFEDLYRTPAFMEMMRRNLKAMTDMKTMQDQVVHGAARELGLPLANDIAGLFERLNSTEQTILKRLESIENRLESIEHGPADAEVNGAAKKKTTPGTPRESRRK